MAKNSAPNRPRANLPFVDREGRFTKDGLSTIDQMWRQIAAGFVMVPCTATGTNLIVLTPILSVEGGLSYGNYMTWVAVAAATSTGAVTAKVMTTQYGDLATIKVFTGNGATQANSGDIVAGSLYLWIYNSALDSGAGAFVLK